MANTSIKILAFAGSTRKESLNKKLLQIAAKHVTDAGASVTMLNLQDYPLPIYNADMEQVSGLPTQAIELKALFKSHSGFLIASPEYNSSITPLLKNTLDWVTRPHQGEFELECYKGKVAALVSASPGALGGIRSLFALRSLLSNIKVIVLPDMVAVPRADKNIDESGRLTDSKIEGVIKALAEDLVRVVIGLYNR